MTPPAFQIRPLSGSDEFQACVRLQEETWGAGFSERVPEAILRVAARLGGVISGAFLPDGELAGFVFGLTGLEGGRLAHWSDMLAVRPEHRSSGMGRALKLHQRERLLALGVTRMYWTFDPLVARNAHLNFNRLGGVAREYVEDMYRASDSPLHAGIGTDRLVVRWEMDSERVWAALAADTPGGVEGEDGGGEARSVLGAHPDAGGEPEPGEPVTGVEDDAISVAVPAEIQALKERDPALAYRWRVATRAVLSHYLGRGWEVHALVRGTPVHHYLLRRRP